MNYEKKYKEAIEIARKIHNEHKAQPFDVMLKVFPELKEDKDERIRKDIIYFLSRNTFQFGEDIDKYKTWIAWLEKQGEQKTDDKVEPKFKVGDWCIDNEDGTIFQIVKVLNNTYTYETNEGKEYSCTHYSLENDARLWTIQDAKPGDVLANWNNTAFIFKDIKDETVKFHIAYNEKWDAIKTSSTKLSHLGLPEPQFEFHPATKEQRDFLFKKMKEEGYEWNAEKKELEKIIDEKQIKKNLQDNSFRRMFEQKHAWSEEDEHWIQKAINFMKHPDLIKATPTLAKYTISWLKSLKERAQPQKQEWSEEDVNILDAIIYTVKNSGYKHCIGVSNEEMLVWLKSLKDRYTWKPSNEQIFALQGTLPVIKGRGTYQQSLLESLYEDLKKLREE